LDLLLAPLLQLQRLAFYDVADPLYLSHQFATRP
jgi:hypothetical protein